MRVIKSASLEAAYYHGLRYVLENGQIKVCHGTTVKQADEMTLDIMLHEKYKPRYDYGPLKQSFNEQYCAEFLDTTNPHGFVYTYGERMGDQKQYVVDTLKQDITSRQAVISLWDKEKDQESEDPPCMNHIHVYQNTSGTLTLHLTMRSNDFYNALYSNMLGIFTLIQYLNKEIGVRITKYIHTANCPHIYIYEIPNAIKFVSNKIKHDN